MVTPKLHEMSNRVLNKMIMGIIVPPMCNTRIRKRTDILMVPATVASFPSGKYHAIMFLLENSSTKKKESVEDSIATIMTRENIKRAGLEGNSIK